MEIAVYLVKEEEVRFDDAGGGNAPTTVAYGYVSFSVLAWLAD